MKMNKKKGKWLGVATAFVAVSFCISSIATEVADDENMVHNPGFEDYYNGVLKNWVTFYGGSENYDVLPDDTGKWKNVLRLNGSTGKKFSISIQDILMQKGLKYRLSAKMKSTGFTKLNKSFVVLADRKWKWETKRLAPSKINSDWQEYSVDFEPPEKGLYKLIIFKQPDMVGELYFDDIRINRLYSSAGIKFDLSGVNVVGNCLLKGKLVNYQKENAVFEIDLKITAPDNSEVVHQSKKVKLKSDEKDKPLEFNYKLISSGYYTLKCNVSKSGTLVDAVEIPVEFSEKITIKLVKPAMRKLYKFRDTKDLVTEITFNEKINEKCSLSLSVTGRKQSEKFLSKTISLEKSEATSFTTDISRLPFGNYDIRAVLTNSEGMILSSVVQPLDVLNPETAIAFDENHNLLIDGNKVFPWGFTANIVSYGELKRLKDSGFNVLLIYAPNSIEGMKEYLDKLQENGLKGIVFASPYRKNHKMLTELVKTLKNHPALLAYDIADEPGGESMEQFYGAYNLISNEDPYHPVTAIMADNNSYHKFTGIVDVFMVDPYPNSIPKVHQSLVYNFVSQAVSVAKKPVWDVPPTFESSPAWTVPFVAPSPAELRNDFYLAIVAGAKGLIGFTYNNYRSEKRSNNPKDYLHYREDPNRIYLPEKNPAMWAACTTMSKDIELLKPFIFAADSVKHITLPPNKKVFALYKEWDGKRGGLIVNSEPEVITLNIKLPEDFSGALNSPLTGKNINVKNGQFDIKLNSLEELYFEY